MVLLLAKIGIKKLTTKFFDRKLWLIYFFLHYFYIIWFGFNNTYKLTGAPINGVTALNGIVPESPGSIHRQLHSNATAHPHNIVRGINKR